MQKNIYFTSKIDIYFYLTHQGGGERAGTSYATVEFLA